MAHCGIRQYLLQGVSEILQYYNRHRAGIGQLGLQLARGVKRIDVDHHQPGAQRAEQRHRVLQ